MAAGSKGTGTKRSTGTGASRARSGSTAKRSVSGTRSSARSNAGTGRQGSSSARNGKPKKDTASYELQNEVVLMITLVVSVLLFLSNFNLGGKVGSAVNGVMFGLFGIVAYLFPIFLFFGMAFFLANRGSRTLTAKMIYAFGMLLMVTAFIQLLTTYRPAQLTEAGLEEGAKLSLGNYYTLARDFKKGGGIFGGFVCFCFEPLFGKVGSYVVVIALFLVCFMLFSRKAIFAWIGKKSNERYALHKVHAMERRESYEERQAERARLVEEKRQAMQERRAKTYLLSEEEKAKMESGSGVPIAQPTQPVTTVQESAWRTQAETASRPKKEKEKRNFFGGKTPTGDFTLDMNNQYTLPEQTVSEVSALYNEERKEQNAGLHMMEISPETGEYKETTYKRTESPRRGPTVAEQLEALGPGDRATSGGQALWGGTSDTGAKQSVTAETEHSTSKYDAKEKDSTTIDNEDAQTTPHRTRGKASSEPVEPLVIEESEPIQKYEFPPVDLLTKPKGTKGVSERDLQETAQKLQSTLDSFGVRVTVTNVSCGPAVTRYELQPEQGVKVSKITSLADDIKLNLAAADVRIEAPIPGKAAVGIEVPNKENSTVLLRELLESNEFTGHGSRVAFAVGKDIGGQTVVTDIAKMPHLLIAGATGSGKSVCINTLIMSILYKADPSEVKLIMVDPKVVELSVYNGIPHLMIPVVTDPKKASAALNWAVVEMTERYQKFAELGVRDLKGYNERVDEAAKQGLEEEKYKHLPQIVIIVDELADLMMVAPGEVEDSICRLAQLARAAGLHLVIATQRPSVNVITGLIKANIPSRIAFAVSSAIDSRTILDGAGAEKLLGKGDMLFFPSGYSKPVRVQGAFVSDHEVSAVVEFLKAHNEGSAYNTEISEKITNMPTVGSDAGGSSGNANGYDEYFADAGKLIIEKDKASIGMLQRAYKIGFNRAARSMDQLAEAGVVGPEEGTKPRKVLMSPEEFEQFIGDYV
ncbi:MAG: DNA translocase FtsK [Lachnospiraceae bacterium]|nr:DNA translocase FtsK [Lachnospiraceae bacterium]